MNGMMNGIVAPQCPRCGGELLPVAWGMPTLDDWEAGERGEVYIGGCVLPAGQLPRWRCADCGASFAADGAEARGGAGEGADEAGGAGAGADDRA